MVAVFCLSARENSIRVVDAHFNEIFQVDIGCGVEEIAFANDPDHNPNSGCGLIQVIGSSGHGCVSFERTAVGRQAIMKLSIIIVRSWYSVGDRRPSTGN